MKTLLVGIAILISLIAASIIGDRRKWFQCPYCRNFFSNCGDTQRETPAKFEPTCERCQDCQADAEKILNIKTKT